MSQNMGNITSKKSNPPPDWELVKLGEVARIQTGDKDVDEGNPDGIYPFFTCSKEITYSDSYSFDTEAILIAGNGEVGDTKYYKGKFEAYQRTYVLSDFQKNSRYLYYFISGRIKRKLNLTKSGSTMSYIRKGDLENFEVLFPLDKEEQQKIVYVLDTIQEAIGAQEKIIEKTKELKRATMNLLFHYGTAILKVKEFASLRVGELTSEEFEKLTGQKLKKTEIGEIPESWEVVRLEEVVEVRKEQVRPKENDRYVGLEHIESGEISIKRFGRGKEVRSLKNKFYPNDILYGKLRPYLDKVVISTFEGVVSTDLIIFKPNLKKIFPLFLVNLLHTSRFLNFAIATTTGTNHPRTSWEVLKNFKLSLPPLSEQHEIADVLQTIDQKIEIEEKKKALYEELFKAMLDKLMTAEIRVNNINFQ